MKEHSIFLEHVGDSPRMRVLQYLIEGRDFDYTITDMLQAGVSWGTLNQLLPLLAELGIVIKTRKIGRATLYKINKDNETARHLLKLYDELILRQLDSMTKKAEVKPIAIH
jgi:DNA-binding transcriptional ArsR family regulator